MSTSVCCEVTMVRLPDNGLFWKYSFQLFVTQPSHKSNSLSLVSLERDDVSPRHGCTDSKVLIAQKMNFKEKKIPLRISSVNVNKFAGNYG